MCSLLLGNKMVELLGRKCQGNHFLSVALINSDYSLLNNQNAWRKLEQKDFYRQTNNSFSKAF